MSMKLGEKAELTIDSENAYGAAGSPPTIPANATLIFTVELIQVTDRRPTRWMMSDQELISAGLRLKDDGAARFKKQEFKAAEGHYRDAFAHLDTVKNDNQELKDLKKLVLQNLALCANKLGEFKESERHCDKAITIDAKAIKAFYLRS